MLIFVCPRYLGDILETQKELIWLISCFHRDAIVFFFFFRYDAYEMALRGPYDVLPS